jgi:hypothetical protein
MNAIIFNDRYELVEFKEEMPTSLYFLLPEKSYGKFFVLKNGIQALISNVEDWRLTLSFKDEKIFECKTSLDSFLPLVDILNKYSLIVDNDLEKIILDIIKKKKEGLEVDIKNLTKRKMDLKEEMKQILTEFDSLFSDMKSKSEKLKQFISNK